MEVAHQVLVVVEELLKEFPLNEEALSRHREAFQKARPVGANKFVDLPGNAAVFLVFAVDFPQELLAAQAEYILGGLPLRQRLLGRLANSVKSSPCFHSLKTSASSALLNPRTRFKMS